MFCHSHVEPFSGEVAALPRDLPGCACESLGCVRAVSLPGLSEAMGVVRSGLNQPLNVLLDEGYIVVRVAHVLGGALVADRSTTSPKRARLVIRTPTGRRNAGC